MVLQPLNSSYALTHFLYWIYFPFNKLICFQVFCPFYKYLQSFIFSLSLFIFTILWIVHSSTTLVVTLTFWSFIADMHEKHCFALLLKSMYTLDKVSLHVSPLEMSFVDKEWIKKSKASETNSPLCNAHTRTLWIRVCEFMCSFLFWVM